jgi:hypothetical protein
MMSWSIVEETNQFDECLAWHCLPVKPAPTFKTREAAEEWVRSVCNPAGDPLVMDEDNCGWTYFGHTLSKDCACSPRAELRAGDPDVVYLHNEAQ